MSPPNHRPRAWLVVAAFVVAAAALLASALADRQSAAAEETRAPDYAANQLDGSGELSLDDLRGNVVLLNAWATWCTPCREEMPFLERLHRDYEGQGLQVVGVSIDRGDADPRVREFAANLGITFTILRDPKNRFVRTFRTTGVPETLLIGRNGTVLHRWKGPLDEASPEDRTLLADAVAGRLTEETATERSTSLTVPVAFAAGVLSFLSPCFLPLVPTYAAIFTGMGVNELTGKDPATRGRNRRTVLRGGAAFVAGFSVVFVLLGASATFIGDLLYDYRVWITRIGGALLVLFALHLLGVFRFAFAQREFRFQLGRQPVGPAGSFLIGLAFGAGWTPCIGPVLGSILILAAASASVVEGMALLAVYAAGLAVPFLAATLLLDRFMATASWRGRWLPWMERASGVLVLIVAVLLLTGSLERLAVALA